MAIESYYQNEINLVDGTKTLVFKSLDDSAPEATGYGEFEFSYSGLTIIGGSDTACMMGAAALLDEMGFRYYSPYYATNDWIVRPSTISTTLTKAQGTYWLGVPNLFFTYSQIWFNVAAKATLLENLRRWQYLNGCFSVTYDAGHNWGTFVNANSAYLDPSWMTDSDSFALDTMSAGDIDELAQLYASWKLGFATSASKRTALDASDSDLNVSDDFYPFTQKIIDYMRSGTAAIGPYPARSGVPNIKGGAYAYAKHRLAPTTPTSNMFVQVALGFNSTGLSYDELIASHAEKHDEIGLREYLDTVTWTYSKPFVNGRTKRDYFDRYDTPVNTYGCAFTTAEGSGNWLANVVMMRLWVKKYRTGQADFDTTLNEIIADIFDGDPKVKEIYEFWADPFQKFHQWNLKESFDIVNAMQPGGWYKRRFQDYMTIMWKMISLPDQTPKAEQSVPDTSAYRPAIKQFLGMITGIRLNETLHCYGLMRRFADANLTANYPDLRYDANPIPSWQNTEAFPPTEADFNQAYAEIQAAAARDLDLDSDDLVIVQSITPETTATTPATKFYCEGVMSLQFVGPGVVTVTEASGTPPVPVADDGLVIQTPYGEGTHLIQAEGNYIAECTGGYLFLDGFPEVRKDPDGGNAHWLYIPDRCDGLVDILTGGRVRVVDGTGQLDILPTSNPSYVSPADIGPGQIKMDNINTSNTMYILNANRYISMSPYIALLPRVIAEEDFPRRTTIKRGA